MDKAVLDDIEFYDFLALMMCSDPWPDSVARESLDNLANSESVVRGYDDWIDAFHHHIYPTMNHPYSGSF